MVAIDTDYRHSRFGLALMAGPAQGMDHLLVTLGIYAVMTLAAREGTGPLMVTERTFSFRADLMIGMMKGDIPHGRNNRDDGGDTLCANE